MTMSGGTNSFPDFRDDEDAIWGSSSDENELQEHQQQQSSISDDYYGSQSHPSDPPSLQSLRRLHSKQGYLAGLTSHKEESLQKGFDEGFPMGADLGLKIGQLIGQLHGVMALNCIDNEEVKSRARELVEGIKRDCGIKKVLNAKYFDEKVDFKDEVHPVFDKWEKEVKRFMEEEVHRR